MNTQELIIEAYEHSGEGSDLDPYVAGVFDIASPGAVKLLGWINAAYKRVSTWKFPDNHLLDFSSRQTKFYLTTIVKTGTAQAGASSSITLAAAESNVAGRFIGWLVAITGGTGSGQKRVIVGYSIARVATVAYAWDTTPDATSTYELYKRFYRFCEATDPFLADNIDLSPSKSFRSILRIMDMKTKGYLTKGGRLSTFSEYAESVGNPSTYVEKNNTIWFNSAPSEVKSYEVEYIRGLDDLVNATDIPAIPEEFHQVIALLAIWWGLRRDQNWSAAYSTKRDILDTLASIRQPGELEMEGDEDFLEVP